MLDLLGNTENRFSHGAAHYIWADRVMSLRYMCHWVLCDVPWILKKVLNL